MTEPTTFEARLTAAYRAYVDAVPTEFDPADVADAAWVGSSAGGVRVMAGRRSWLLPGVAALLLLALLGVTIAVGGRLLLQARPPIGVDYNGTFTALEAGADGRYDAVVLDDGRIVTLDNLGVELHDPATGALLRRTDLIAPRPTGPRFERLPHGRVLVLDGEAFKDEGASTSVELFNWVIRTMRPSAAMTASRWGFATAVLPDGRVLVSGGAVVGGGEGHPMVRAVHTSAEIFDPETGRFTATGEMASPRVGHSMTALADGHVLVAGGNGDTGILTPFPPARTANLELFDPTTGTFSPAGTMSDMDVSAVLAIPDRRALIIHESCMGRLASAREDRPASTDIFDAATGRIVRGPELPHCVDAAAVLPTGLVFLEGFWPEPRAYRTAPPIVRSWSGLLDPASGDIRLTDPPGNPPSVTPRITAVLADGGVVLLPIMGATGPWDVYH